MTETESSHLATTPQSPQTPAASGRAHLPLLTRASLNALCDAGGISPAAWLRAMEFCGFRPNGKAWLAYWRQLCLLGGALFFVAGVVCFIAWNWGAMTPLARMALTGAVVAGSGLASVLLGPDTRLGRVLRAQNTTSMRQNSTDANIELKIPMVRVTAKPFTGPAPSV